MTQLPKKLQEARDNAVTQIVKGYDDIDGHDYDVCRKGFDSCASLLLPEIEKLVEASAFTTRTLGGWLDRLSVEGVTHPSQLTFDITISELVNTLKRHEKCLAKWREFTGDT